MCKSIIEMVRDTSKSPGERYRDIIAQVKQMKEEKHNAAVFLVERALAAMKEEILKGKSELLVAATDNDLKAVEEILILNQIPFRKERKGDLNQIIMLFGSGFIFPPESKPKYLRDLRPHAKFIVVPRADALDQIQMVWTKTSMGTQHEITCVDSLNREWKFDTKVTVFQLQGAEFLIKESIK